MLLIGEKLLPSSRSLHIWPKLLPFYHILPFLKPSSQNPNPTILIPLISKPFSSSSSSSKPSLSFIRGGCYPENGQSHTLPPLCPGCGVHMQSSDPSLPGFFSSPSAKSPDYRAPLDRSRPIPLSHLPLFLKTNTAPSQLSPNDNVHDEEEEKPNSKKPLVPVCARCHSLRHYGHIKNPSSESLLPDFDFDRMVTPKILSPYGPRSVVLLVVDTSDFEGSFPKKLSKSLSMAIDKNYNAWKEGKPGNVPRVLLVATKCDVLPSSVSPERLEEWIRGQVHEQGTMRLTGVHLVSSVKDWGVRNLVEHVKELVGSRGNVWAVGAQNAGKSTLINAMGRCILGGKKMSQLTEAPVPGTTLGIVKVEGVLNGQAKLFDTPGILHPYQITMRLGREEQKLVHVGKELRPRTYRIKAGHSVHIGGLMRLDVEESSVESIYLTVWASPLLPLHMGRTENASKMIEDHFGRQLQPPVGEDRIAELGKWSRREFRVSGNSWDANSVDIAAAGLGWVAVGMKGEAVLGVWTYDGVDVVSRRSLVSERARIFEEAGFTVSRIVSQADSVHNRSKIQKEKKRRDSKVKLNSTPSVTLEADMII